MEQAQEVNKFLSGILMGKEVFKNYAKLATSEEIKNAIDEIMDSFNRHDEAISDLVFSLGGMPKEKLGFMESMSEFFEKLRLMNINSDYDLCKMALNAIEMGIKSGLDFIHEHKNLPELVINEVKGVVYDYDNHLSKIKALMIDL